MRLLPGCRLRQSTCLEKKIVGMFLMHVGLTLTDLVLRDRAELDRLQAPALELDVGDDALPQDRLIEQRIRRRDLENKIAQIEEDRMPVVNLDAVRQGSSVHHD